MVMDLLGITEPLQNYPPTRTISITSTMGGKRELKIYNTSSLCQPGDGHQDLISESTMENLPFQDMTEIYKPNSKFCTIDKL